MDNLRQVAVLECGRLRQVEVVVVPRLRIILPASDFVCALVKTNKANNEADIRERSPTRLGREHPP